MYIFTGPSRFERFLIQNIKKTISRVLQFVSDLQYYQLKLS